MMQIIINTTSVYSFQVQRDTVLLEYVFGNDTETRRNMNETQFVVNTTDANGTIIPNLNITFYVTLDGSTPDTGTSNTTNSSGHAIYNFLAGC